MIHSDNYFQEVATIAQTIDSLKVELMAQKLADIRQRGGRVFVLGVGGSAGNASHMVNDLRKLCGIETYCPTDNVPELTARTNDEGFDTVFEEYLKVSRLNKFDAIFILSVGGGNKAKNVSVGLCNAIDLADRVGAQILGIVGKTDGYTFKMGNCVVAVPEVDKAKVTPHSEAFQGVIWHCLVSNPILQKNATKW